MRGKLSNHVKIAVLSGLSFMLLFLPHIPIFPPAPFLTYDFSDIPALIGGFALGPLSGMAVVALKNFLVLLHSFDPPHLIGMPMNVLAGCTMVGISSWYYWKKKSLRSALAGLVWGTLAMAAAMIPANYLIFDIFMEIMHIEPSFSAAFYVFAFAVPFNLLKGFLSSLLAFMLYKRVASVLK
ncbi:MAG: ECF transporter S component [bacterium]|nr:ECF transporter S component [bacterium]